MNSWATPKRSSHLRALRQVSQFFSPYRVVGMPGPSARDAGHDAEHHRERLIPVVVTVFGVKGFRAVTARATFTPSAPPVAFCDQSRFHTPGRSLSTAPAADGS